MSKRITLSFHFVALTMLAAVVAILAIGGRPDPIGPALALDGSWRFHPGDDPRWADPAIDDGAWDRIDLVSSPDSRDDDVGLPGWLAGWNAHGHPGLAGHGWYRRHVDLPAQGDIVLLGPTMVDDGYRMFWNGRPVGGFGKVDDGAKLTGVHPYLVGLPRAPGERSGVLAIRTFMQPGHGRDNLSGGLRSVPTMATAAFGETLHRAQWWRTIAGYVVEAALPLAMVSLAGIALVVARSTARPGFSRWLVVALIATAFLRLGNAIAAWTDLLDATWIDWLNTLLWSPLVMLSWTAAWNDWTDGRGRRAIRSVAVATWALWVGGAIADVATVIAFARIVFIVLFGLVAIRIARRGDRRPLALATMLAVAAALFVNELRRLGLPDIWFPFHIGVTLTQYAYALAVLLLPFLLGDRQAGAPASRRPAAAR